MALDVNVAATGGGKTSELLVTDQTGGTALTSFAGRKFVEIQNLGPNAIYATVDGSAPVVDKCRKIAAAGSWSLNAGPVVSIRLIAASAAQETGAATIVTELS